MKSWLGATTQALLEWVAPRCCACCSRSCRGLFCADCEVSLPPPPARARVGDVRLCAAQPYADPVAHAVRQLKFGGRSDLAVPLADLLGPVLDGCRVELVVPVPLHAQRLADRGYNQACLLARRVVRHCAPGARLAPLVLRRTRHTAQQAQQDRARRLENVAGAFAVARPSRVRGQRVLLVDDVLTTGATALECVQALRASGAREVTIAVVCLADTAAGPAAGG